MSILETLIAYSVAATLLTLTPGLDTALILRTSAVEGGKKAFQAALGIDVGCFIWGAAVAFGLGVLFTASEVAYSVLKWCGAIYLLWLGSQLLFKSRQQVNLSEDMTSPKAQHWFVKGLFSNLLNPKMGIFYLSFLPQFIPLNHSPTTWTFLLVTIHVFIGTLWSLILIIASRHISKLLNNTRLIIWIDRITGGLFIYFSMKLVLSHR